MSHKNQQSTREAIAARLKDYRREHHLGQKQMAHRLGVKLKAYESYEEARAKPDLKALAEICKLLSLSLSDIIQSKPEPS